MNTGSEVVLFDTGMGEGGRDAGMGSTAAYLLYKKTRDQRDRIKEAKVEMIEMQRTIDRLRAELGREHSLRIEDHQGPQYQVLTARLGLSICPYCKDDVVKGPACPRCGARYRTAREQFEAWLAKE